MIYLISVMSLTVLLTMISKKVDKGFSKWVIILLSIILSLFIGLRTRYNDTYTYMDHFIRLVPNSLSEMKNIELSLAEYPGFVALEIILKSCISSSPQILILTTATITTFIFVWFYSKYSDDFTLSMYLYVTGGLLVSSMGGIKQHLAMAISMLSVQPLLEKKYLKFILIILFASLFHPFVLMFLILPFLMDKTWSTKITTIILATVISAFLFEQFVGFVVELANEGFGSGYATDNFTSATGMNILRVLVFSVPPILSFFVRKFANKDQEPLMIVSINASIISFCFTILGMFGGANLFGRLAYYFLPFTYIALPTLFKYYSDSDRKIIKIACVIGYFLFFIITYKDFVYYNIFNYKWY